MLNSLTREAMRTSAFCSISSALAINGYLGPRRLSLYSTFASSQELLLGRTSPFVQEYADFPTLRELRHSYVHQAATVWHRCATSPSGKKNCTPLLLV